MSAPSRPRPRPAHTAGCTRCVYTPSGRQLVTVGANNTIRLYKTGFDGEPTNVDDCQEQNVGVAATDDFFVVGSEDGTVSLYALAGHTFERFLLRTSLPVRDVALSPDGRWCAVASDELTVRVVGTADNTVVRHLRAHHRPAKHVAFDPKGRTVAVACTDGVIYVYSMTETETEDEEDEEDGGGGSGGGGGDPALIRKIDGVIGPLEADAEASAHIAWHPDGRTFAVATPTRDIQVVSKHDWEKQRVFAHGHEGAVTALAWSPNGALLASAGQDGKLLLWETKTQSVVARYDYAGVQDIAWHPTGNNLVSFANGEGEVYICPDFLPAQYAVLLRLPLQPSPFIHDPLAEIPANVAAGAAGAAQGLVRRPQPGKAARSGLVDRAAVEGRDGDGDEDGDEDEDAWMNGGDENGGLGGDGLDLDDDDDDDGFVVDDDGAGYTAGGGGHKRPHAALGDDDNNDGRGAKRAAAGGGGGALWKPQYHAAFQPGSTPWRGNRKYLCLNLVGVVWTVDQDAHHTVTVEFYDRAFQRDFHFTDTFLYDKACLAEHGTLFSCPPGGAATPAMVFYRPHETWTQQRLDWRTALPAGEAVVALSLSASHVAVATTADLVRVYTLFGVPCRVYRPKSTPVVTCASWRDYVWTLGNGPMAPDGTARLLYSIENVQSGVLCQNEDTVALPRGGTVQSVFFSDEGDPCIYDSTGTLLTLLHWRQPGRAVWVPLLDTRQMARLASGRKHESYFPIAVADRKFHCIILKGGDRYPYFPRPLLSEFEFALPVGGREADVAAAAADDTGDADADAAEARRLEHAFVLHGVHAAQLADRLASSRPAASGAYALKTALARLELETDKTLLQLLALECRAGEERGMRALELVRLMRDGSGKMMEAAGKVADRYGRSVLGQKIRELGERRVQARLGLGEEEEGEEEEL